MKLVETCIRQWSLIKSRDRRCAVIEGGRGWVFILGHFDLSFVFHSSCWFLLCFQTDWRAGNCIIARNSLSFYNHIKILKKAHKCSILLLNIPFWVLVNTFRSNFILTSWLGIFISSLCVNSKNTSINTRVDKRYSLSKGPAPFINSCIFLIVTGADKSETWKALADYAYCSRQITRAKSHSYCLGSKLGRWLALWLLVAPNSDPLYCPRLCSSAYCLHLIACFAPIHVLLVSYLIIPRSYELLS